MAKNRTRLSAAKLTLLALLMFGFGYALIPLYSIFCDITGLNGKTGVVDAYSTETAVVDESREITVEFVANLNQGLNWEFDPIQTRMRVHPGKIYTTHYIAQNRSAYDMIGQAVPSVQPSLASRHFNKTECFCFSNQILKANEKKTMPVSFVIDPKLPRSITVVTLSYTFFDVTQSVKFE